MQIVESFKRQVDSSEDVHGLLRRTGGMPVTSLYTPLQLTGLQPDSSIQIEDGKIIQCHLAVPPTENVHMILIDDSGVPKSNFRFLKKAQVVRNAASRQQHHMLLRVWFYFLTLDIAPAIGADLVAVHIGEDMSFVATSVNIKLIEISDE